MARPRKALEIELKDRRPHYDSLRQTTFFKVGAKCAADSPEEAELLLLKEWQEVMSPGPPSRTAALVATVSIRSGISGLEWIFLFQCFVI